MADSHSIMPKKLAMALMDAGVQHFDGGGLLGGLGSFLGTNSNFQASGLTPTNQNLAPQIQTQQQRQSDVYGQQQNLANTLLKQSQGQGPNPALAQLNQQTGANVANQAALMAGQRGASANPGLIARQAAMQGANTQQQAVGQGATLQAQQQLAAQNALAGQQQNLAQNALSGESIDQGALSSQNNAALGIQQINANTAGQNAAGNRGLVGGLINAAGGVFGLAKGGEVPHMATGGVMQMENYGNAPSIPSWQDPTGGSYGITPPVAPKEAPTYTGTAQPWEQGGGLAGSPMDTMSNAAPVSPGAGMSGELEGIGYAAQGGKIPFSTALLGGGKVPGQASVKGDSKENDTQPTMLSPGEEVIDRETLADPGPIGKAARLVAQHINAKKGGQDPKAQEFLKHLKSGKKKSYGDVIGARKACGGKI